MPFSPTIAPEAAIPFEVHAAPAASPLPPREARFPRFVGLSAPVARLGGLRLALIAAGSVNSHVALGAARLCPETMWIVDPARLKPESALTHPIPPSAIGELKAIQLARRCKAISPATRVFACSGRIQEVRPAALAECTHVLLASDNLSAELATGALCLELGVPLIQAAVHGETMTVQVRCFSNRDGDGPCPACQFGPSEWDHLQRESLFRCDGQVEAVRPQGQPTLSTAFLCSLAADLALVQLTRLVLELGPPVADTLISWCGYTHRTLVSHMRRRPDCPGEHARWSRVRLSSCLRHATLRQVARAAGVDLEPAAHEVSFAVRRLAYHEAAVCCGATQRLGRFGPSGRPLGTCAVCSGPLNAGSFHTRDAVPASAVDLDLPLESLGASTAELIVVRCGERACLVLGQIAEGGCA